MAPECAVDTTGVCPDMAKLVTIRTYTDIAEARVAMALLDQHGFVVYLADHHYVEVAWYALFAVGGLRLQVPEAEALAAGNLLADAVKSEPEFAIDRCPACGSERVFRHASKLAATMGLILGFVPVILRTRKRTCRRCGHVWKL